MKFAAHLNAHITPEWRTQYIAYEDLKELLYTAQEHAPAPDVSNEDALRRFYSKFDHKFFVQCEQELDKINMFYAEKLAEAYRKGASLNAELRLAKRSHEYSRRDANKPRSSSRLSLKFDLTGKAQNPQSRKISDLKLAYSEHYLSLILLQNYQSLNFTGFRKILKKHDKICESESGMNFQKKQVEVAPFHVNKQIDAMISECEETYIRELENGDRGKAMKRLRVPPLAEKPMPVKTFLVGLFLGTFISLLILVAIGCVFLLDYQEHFLNAYLQIYRGLFIVVLFLALLGGNVYGWSKHGVNHVLIFELDPRNHLMFADLLEVAFLFGTIWALSVVFFLASPLLAIPVFISPLVCVCLFVILLLFPAPILKSKARYWLIKYLFRVFTAPFHSVTFPDFWLADQLNSLKEVLLDFEYMICFYVTGVDWTSDGLSGPYQHGTCESYSYGARIVVAMLPAWFRFAQCCRRLYDTRKKCPHAANAGKYFTRLFVAPLAGARSIYAEQNGAESIAWLAAWAVASCANSVYSLIWDLKMDWGLMTCESKEDPCLREETVYPHKSFYYFAIIQNMILRFAWVSKLVNIIHPYVNSIYLSTILAVLSVLRRFIWNYLRLENEHLNNCGEFRATRDISVAPIEEDCQSVLCDMMDNPDLVINKKIPCYSQPTSTASSQPIKLSFPGLKLRRSVNKHASYSTTEV